MNNYWTYTQENVYNSAFNPSGIHSQNTALTQYFARYLFKKVLAVFKFEIPETWAENYFKAVLFGDGVIAVFDTDKYGVIPQRCGLGGYNVFYQPRWVIIANPLIKTERAIIGDTCEIIKLQPDYTGCMDIVSTYAEALALCMEGAGMNLINSKLAYVFTAQNKTAAESFKKLYDQIAGGNPAAVIDKDLMNEDGRPNWLMFSQNLGQNYITDRILNDMQTIDNRFCQIVGIPSANTSKRERLITDEVNANNIHTNLISDLWLETMRRDIDKVNKMFGTDIKVSKRYEDLEQ